MGNRFVEWLAALTSSAEEAAPDILVLQFTIVNAFLVGAPGGPFALVDTGLENAAAFIAGQVEARFGPGARPAAIVLTHGHFDHVGSVVTLADRWRAPVYAHPLEMPYLTGRRDYPVADPAVSSGMVAKLSPTFPHRAVNLGTRVQPLPADGTVPGMPGWRWLHTPGHTEGHVSLFRGRDRVLIAGDAFSTVRQESLLSVVTQREQLSGPPQYLTVDWEAAERSVALLRDLQPDLALPSHGRPMRGRDLRWHLDLLASRFREIAVPEQGRFVEGP